MATKISGSSCYTPPVSSTNERTEAPKLTAVMASAIRIAGRKNVDVVEEG